MTVRPSPRAILILVCTAAFTNVATAAHVWQVWRNPGQVARIPTGYRTIMSSSACPGACAYDRHSRKDPRFIRIEDGEGVIFEHEGPGVVTRIWMTQGDGVSHDLDPRIRLRIRIDGQVAPVIDLSLADFFSGSAAPFLQPTVLDRAASGGGNVSYVPIPFSRACRISLVGAEAKKIWYQVTAVVSDGNDPISAFRVDDTMQEWRAMLGLGGADPWPASRGWPTISGALELAAGERWRLAEFDGPDQITGLVLRVPRQRWPALTLHIAFDGVETVSLPLPWFFGVSAPGCDPMKSLLIGVDGDELYSWFPMPFDTSATVDLELAESSSEPVQLQFALRRSGRGAPSDAGIFHADAIDDRQQAAARTTRLLEIDGPSRLVGLALTAGAVDEEGWSFLEGDESIIVDGNESWKGTGVEDFFNGGFYFRNENGNPEPTQAALSGLTCVRGTPTRPTASLYRLMPTDGPIAQRKLIFDWEGGRTGDLPVRWRGVYWYYTR